MGNKRGRPLGGLWIGEKRTVEGFQGGYVEAMDAISFQ